jgi:hypothetical protein
MKVEIHFDTTLICEQISANQKRLGVIPANAKLTPWSARWAGEGQERGQAPPCLNGQKCRFRANRLAAQGRPCPGI